MTAVSSRGGKAHKPLQYVQVGIVALLLVFTAIFFVEEMWPAGAAALLVAMILAFLRF